MLADLAVYDMLPLFKRFCVPSQVQATPTAVLLTWTPPGKAPGLVAGPELNEVRLTPLPLQAPAS